MENNLAFLKHLIKNMHPDWTNAQVEIEALRAANRKDEDDDEDACLYCGS